MAGKRRFKKEEQGSARMKALKKKRVEVWFNEREYAALVAYCEDKRRAIATFVHTATLDAIEYQGSFKRSRYRHRPA